MSIGTREESFNRWGLKDNPFISLPPTTEEERQKVFTGRHDEIEKLKNLVTRPRGIFLVGLFGVGKSILALETLRLLAEQGYTSVYAKYNRNDGFELSVLRKLAEASAKQDIIGVYDALVSGRRMSSNQNPCIKDVQDAIYSCKSVMGAIENITNLVNPKSKIVIVVDDLDKGTDIADINEIIMDTRGLIEYGCSVILPGHPFGPTAGFSSSKEILYPLSLMPLSEEELMEMMGKYLSLARIIPLEKKSQYYPFTPTAARIIARIIAKFKLTPRIFNFACQLLLEYAAESGIEYIDEHFISSRWNKIAKDFLITSIKDEDKKCLEVIYNDNVDLSEDTREVIQKIGGQYAQYVEVRNILSGLLQKNVLIEREKDGKRVINLDPIFDKDFRILL